MPPPPILEIYVVWHPDDEVGATIGSRLIDHFHGPAYSGLAGGAVEVYLRSAGWRRVGGSPRPLPFMAPLPARLAPAQVTVVVPILGRGLAHAVRRDTEWRAYIESTFTADKAAAAHAGDPIVCVYPLAGSGADLSDTELAALAGKLHRLPPSAADSAATLAREVAQAITQRLGHVLVDAGIEERLTVFISHTRKPGGPSDRAPVLVDTVRDVLRDTHLDGFLDARDIQPGDDWEAVLDAEASRHCMLMVRTDRYASREWTQREVHAAKVNDIPIVCLYAVRGEEQRGSFLMDHVPVVACAPGVERQAVETALNRLVDEALKRALWQAQRSYLERGGFDWLPVHAPEPVTVTAWLKKHHASASSDPRLVVIHPDPPLGPRERQVILDLCTLAGADRDADILTPRTFASRGGRLA